MALTAFERAEALAALRAVIEERGATVEIFKTEPSAPTVGEWGGILKIPLGPPKLPIEWDGEPEVFIGADAEPFTITTFNCDDEAAVRVALGASVLQLGRMGRCAAHGILDCDTTGKPRRS